MATDIALAQGSLTEGNELLLVNASNTNAVLGSGVSGAIRAACGRGYQEHIQEELQRQFAGPMNPGEVMLTDAGAHPRAKYVAHVAVMDYREGFSGGSYPTLDVFRTGCERLWDLAEGLTSESRVSVAMVALGAGTGNLGVREPTRVACETLKAHLALHSESRIARVVFYGYSLPELLVIAQAVCKQFPGAEASLPVELRAALASMSE
ncbi:MAG: macro domain-containing protein [Myxococcaceae bacterium]